MAKLFGTSGMRDKTNTTMTPQLVLQIDQALATIFPKVKEQTKIDRFCLILKQKWLLIRPSGTETLIRLTVEAETRKTAEALMKKTVKLIDKLVKEIC